MDGEWREINPGRSVASFSGQRKPHDLSFVARRKACTHSIMISAVYQFEHPGKSMRDTATKTQRKC